MMNSSSKQVTVGELRERLAESPDDAPVFVYDDARGAEYTIDIVQVDSDPLPQGVYLLFSSI
jgi:hypothetical protein